MGYTNRCHTHTRWCSTKTSRHLSFITNSDDVCITSISLCLSDDCAEASLIQHDCRHSLRFVVMEIAKRQQVMQETSLPGICVPCIRKVIEHKMSLC